MTSYDSVTLQGTCRTPGTSASGAGTQARSRRAAMLSCARAVHTVSLDCRVAVAAGGNDAVHELRIKEIAHVMGDL